MHASKTNKIIKTRRQDMFRTDHSPDTKVEFNNQHEIESSCRLRAGIFVCHRLQSVEKVATRKLQPALSRLVPPLGIFHRAAIIIHPGLFQTLVD